MTDIVITNEIIKINTKIYVIKNVEYKEEEFSLMPVTAPMIVGLIVVVYFFQNIYTMALLILLILLSIPKKTFYKTYINNELLKSTITFNKNDFLELKRKIEEALHSNHNEPIKEDFDETVKRNKFQESLKKQEEKYRQRYKENTQIEKTIIKKEPMNYADKKVFKNCAIEIFRDDYYNCRYEILKF